MGIVTVSDAQLPAAQLPAALRHRTSFVLARLAALTRMHCAERLATLGLNQHQHAILCCLDEFGPAIQRDVAARLDLDSGDLVSFLDRLQDAELLRRERDPRDRRRQILTITPAGQRLLRRAEALLDEAEPDLFAGLPGARVDELRALATDVLARHAAQAWRDQDALA
ncbi:MarR family transcriptional regulator [Frankia sp. QA3]|uniref:MarR family winged helix-turn-helix transcriptional regulator n=1 Tax=Frankia sp. QA3 TaxID=710111 RepID=UPI0002EBA6C3